MASLFSRKRPNAPESEAARPEEAPAEPPVPPAGGPSPLDLYAGSLVEAIRAASSRGKLTASKSLSEGFPIPQELAAEPGFGVPAALEAAPDAGDIGRLEGSEDLWYFSEKYLTGAYALHLLRIEEKDLARLIAATVRDDSRIYPRPTDLRFFSDPPFSLGEREVRQTLGMMELRPDMADIRRCAASNGALYLYSTTYLSDAVAAALTEWIEVGQRENP